MKGMILCLAAAAAVLVPAEAGAQVLGTFSWQMQPYCNRLTLTLTASPGGFTASGYDDQCGAVTRASASGVAVLNPNGTVGINVTIVAPSPGASGHLAATVSPTNGQGTWVDDLGNSGTFGMGANLPGLPVRPRSPRRLDVAENPNETSDPCAIPTARPTMMLCGTSSDRWMNGGFGLSGLQVWRDRDGRVHLSGSARRSGTSVGGAIFSLPESHVPERTLGFSIATGMSAGVHQGGTALLVIYGRDVPGSAGFVAVYSASTAYHNVVHFGEIVFTP